MGVRTKQLPIKMSRGWFQHREQANSLFLPIDQVAFVRTFSDRRKRYGICRRTVREDWRHKKERKKSIFPRLSASEINVRKTIGLPGIGSSLYIWWLENARCKILMVFLAVLLQPKASELMIDRENAYRVNQKEDVQKCLFVVMKPFL